MNIPGNPLPALGGVVLVAALGLTGWFWLSAERAQARAVVAYGLVETMRTTAQGQNARYRQLEKESADAMQQIIEGDRRSLDAIAARLVRMREQARIGGSGVPTVPAVAGSLEACQQRLAHIGRAVDEVDRVAEAVRGDAGRCAQDVATLTTCQADLRRCDAIR